MRDTDARSKTGRWYRGAVNVALCAIISGAIPSALGCAGLPQEPQPPGRQGAAAADGRATSAPATPAASVPGDEPSFQRARRDMVERQLRARDIGSRSVLDAMGRVPRHVFVPASLRMSAYDDRPLPIGAGQTISQPYVVAYMTEALDLRPEHKVLEIGTGSGYQAAVLAELAQQVFTIEIVPELADGARRALTAAGYTNVQVRLGDGYAGWPELAPFPRIIVTAAPPEIPDALVEQLAVGGRMVLPVGEGLQRIVIVTKGASGATTQETIPVRFVPMVRGRP